MSRWIDADALRANINTIFWAEIGKIIESAPSFDIVRCKECKHREKCEQMVVFENGKYITSGYKLDYCSYGESEGE